MILEATVRNLARVVVMILSTICSQIGLADTNTERAIVSATSQLCSSSKFFEIRENRKKVFSSLSEYKDLQIPDGVENLPIWEEITNYGSQDACRYVVSGYLFEQYVKSKVVEKTCRHPSHGIERYQGNFVATENSGWRKGGYDQTKWCNDYLSMLKARYPESKLEVVSKSERNRDSCPPFRCIQYRYECSVRVQRKPIYREAASPYCP